MAALLALVCVAGCASPLPFGLTPSQTTATDATKIERFYAAIEALPAYPTVTTSCVEAEDVEVYYHLVFHFTTSSMVQVDIAATGCQGVYFDGTRHPPAK
jgi:hypothetical protein